MHGSAFEDYVTTTIKDRYNLMCSIEVYYIISPTINDDSSSGGGRPLLYESTIDVLVSLGLTLKFFYSWV